MAVKNSLAKLSKEELSEVKQELKAVYTVGNEEIRLTPTIVKEYLVSGNSEDVSVAEVAMFIKLCQYQKLNPWLKEAYCIKYGSSPATVVVGKEAFMKRAEDNVNYDGDESGIIVADKTSGEIHYRTGTLKLRTEDIVGGWAEVWRKDRSHSKRVEVSFDEYVGKTRDGKMNSQWSQKPGTMIRKVALVQALREAFPQSLGGMYTAEEQGFDESSPVEVQTTIKDSNDEVEYVEIKEEQEESIEDALFGE